MTLDDLFTGKDRGDGRRFTQISWPPDLWFEPIFRVRDYWFGLLGDSDGCFYTGDDFWTEWHEPKPKKKVTMYRPVYKNLEGKYFLTNWVSNRSEPNYYPGAKLVSWESREIEVDE